jgi:predicted secreted protein with PEFG-CTERM motif
MKYNNLYLLLALALVFGVTAIIPPVFATTVQVTIMPGSGSGRDCAGTVTCFSPSLVDISPGDTVTWRNDDNVAHDLTDGLPYENQTGILFDSGAIAPATTYSFTFQNSGDFRYFAKDTTWMVGEVIVGPSTGGGSTVPEFGPVALVLVISVMSIIVISTRTRLRFSQF